MKIEGNSNSHVLNKGHLDGAHKKIKDEEGFLQTDKKKYERSDEDLNVFQKKGINFDSKI